MNNKELQQYVTDNPSLVTMRESVRYPGLFVIKYKKKVFWDNLWDEHLEVCRGLVVDKDFNIIIRPFNKIYNYGIEPRAPKLSGMVWASRKINGFMVSITKHNGQLIIATTGSLDSDFVKMAEEMLTDVMKETLLETIPDNKTFMFECCHPNDPHIIMEKHGMYFTGVCDNSISPEEDRDVFDTVVASCYYYNKYCYELGEVGFYLDAKPELVYMDDLLARMKHVTHEGYVLYSFDGKEATKIKSQHYLVKKFVARCKNVEKLTNKDIYSQFDEEYYGLMQKIQSELDHFVGMPELDRLMYVEKYFIKTRGLS